MKKILLAIMILSLSIACFAGCSSCNNGDDSNSVVDSGSHDIDSGSHAEVTPFDLACEYVRILYEDKPAATPVDYELVASVTNSGIVFNLDWSVTPADKGIEIVPIDGNKVSVKIPDVEEDFDYTLIATLHNTDGTSKTFEFARKVVATSKINTYDEFVKAEKGATLTVEGIITGIASKTYTGNNCLYIENEDGAFYAFAGKKDPIADLHLEIGKKVRVTGTKDIYDVLELTDYDVVKIYDDAPVTVTPTDYTEIYKNAKDLTDSELTKYHSKFIIIHGVTVGSAGDNGYYYFTLDGKQTYLRISGSKNALDADQTAAFQAAHASHIGATCDVKGVVAIYKGAFNMIPVTEDAFCNFVEVERTDAEKVAFEKGLLENYIDETVASLQVKDLADKGQVEKDVAITWAVNPDNSAAAVIADGKLTFNPQKADVSVVVTATLTCGDATDTITYNVTVKAQELLPVNKPLILTMNCSKGTLYYNGTIPTSKEGVLQTWYLGTTDNIKEAVPVTLEFFNGEEGKYLMYATINGVKTYIEMTQRETQDNATLRLVEDKDKSTIKNYYTYNSVAKTLVCQPENVSKEYFIGTTKTYNTFSANSIDALAGGYPSYFVDVPEITDTEKVAAEIAALNIDTERVTAAKTINLPVNGTKYPEVTISWTVDNTDLAKIAEDGKSVTISLPEKDATIILTAAVKSGDVESTQTFAIAIKGTAVKTAQEIVDAAAASFELEIKEVHLGEEVVLPTSVEDLDKNSIAILWKVGDTVITDGKYTVPAETTETQLTFNATFTSGDATAVKDYNVAVTAKPAGEEVLVDLTVQEEPTNNSYMHHTTKDGWQIDASRWQPNDWKNTVKDADNLLVIAGYDKKKNNQGKMVSTVISGGISSLSFNYAYGYSEGKGIDFTINIKDKDGNILKTDNKVVADGECGMDKTFVYKLDNIDVKGEFIIELINNAPTKGGNKDRLGIYDLKYTTNP